ncbi:phage tail family protein [Bacillus infantis]|uniref:phage tail family protein n=1 Tax=Bacillus infantis TaxID=324767 RepID=UPI002FBE6C06
MPEKITFINSRGQSIELSNRRPFLLGSVEGKGDVQANVQTQKTPFQDGSTPIDVLLNERSLTLPVMIMSETQEALLVDRQHLSAIFNPKLGEGILVYENLDVKREIKAIPESVPSLPTGFENNGFYHQRTIINLFCPNPYWRSLQITEEPTFQPLFRFPFEGEFQMGMQRDQRIIDNDGDAPVPIQVEFYGPAVNPLIRNNTTGEFIRVNQELLEGEYMKIDTAPGNKSVFFVSADGSERNVFNWIDLNSTFFSLVIGENDIEYTADNDIQGAIVNIRYQKLYTAV